MSTGIKIINAFGETILSTENKSMHFIGKFTASIVGGFHTATFTCPAKPMVFMQGAQSTWFCVHRVINNGNGTWTAKMTAKTGVSAGPASVTIYVFAPASEHATGYGIRVFMGNGEPAIDSSKRILVPYGAATSAAFSLNSAGGFPSRGLDWGSFPTNWAICAPSMGAAMFTGVPSVMTSIGVAYESATTVKYGPGATVYQIPQEIAGFIDIPANMQIIIINTDLYQ